MTRPTLADNALDLLWRNARTYSYFTAEPVPDEMLRRLYDIACMAPTSMNCQPMRLVFLTTPQAKERLLPALSAGNVDKSKSAPVVAIIGTDTRFYEQLPRTFPQMPTAKDLFAGNAALADTTAFRNSSMQGGYFILAARSLGLDCGPMSGFDNAKVDAEFFPDGSFKSNFVCNLGYGDASKLFPRNPRLSFDDACQIL